MLPYLFIQDAKQIGPFLKSMADDSINTICLDIETTGLNPFFNTILLLQIKAGEKVFIFDYRKLGTKFMTYIVSLIQGTDKIIIGHNIRFDVQFLGWDTKEVLDNLYCTQTVEQLLYAGLSYDYPSLASLTEKYYNVILDKSIRQSFIDFEGELTEEQIKYSYEDVLYLEGIREKQLTEVIKVNMLPIIDLENRFLTVVSHAYLHGIKLNPVKWRELIRQSEIEVEVLSLSTKDKVFDDLLEKFVFEDAYDLCETVHIPVKKVGDIRNLQSIKDVRLAKDFIISQLNFRSPPQMRFVLKALYDLPVEDTNAKTLKKFRGNSFVQNLQRIRQLKKSISSFGENYISAINPITGRVHPTINSVGPATGRTSCKDPNLQNIKRQIEYRQAWEAEFGWLLLDTDYSQQEYRITGAISKEPAIIQAYIDGKDMHTATAASVFQVAMDKVTRDMRDTAKTYNFAIIYGANKWGLSFALGISEEEAEKIIKRFYKGYPRLAKYKQEFEEFVMKYKYSVTKLGRRRYFPKITKFVGVDADKQKYKYDRMLQKEGFNHAIQGTGADIVKIAMCEAYYNNPFGEEFKIILTVHDEILCEVKVGIAKEAQEFLEKCMLEAEQPFLGEIPAVVESKIDMVWSH